MEAHDTITIKPFLTVNNCSAAIDFYVAAFGAVVVETFEMPDQKLSSTISIGNSEIYVADEEPAYGNVSPNPSLPSSVRLVLHTKDADQFFEAALKYGATAICLMTTEEDWRIGKLKDPFGHIWEIGYKL